MARLSRATGAARHCARAQLALPAAQAWGAKPVAEKERIAKFVRGE
jgi:mitochondrial fission protein ELM1